MKIIKFTKALDLELRNPIGRKVIDISNKDNYYGEDCILVGTISTYGDRPKTSGNVGSYKNASKQNGGDWENLGDVYTYQ